jgi:hypothetical protein
MITGTGNAGERMRLLVYNIAYGTGTAGGIGTVFSAHRYLRTREAYLDRIIDFIDGSDADVVGLVEIDTGSFRTGFIDQASLVAERLKHYSLCGVKYGRNSIGRHIPILRKQANAFFTRLDAAQENVYYFPVGFKKLILELHIAGIRFFLVHLALGHKTRQAQLDYLMKIAAINPEPVVIAGDFNAFDGAGEVERLMTMLDLYDPNREALPTYPSGNPKLRLDFVLCSRAIRSLRFTVPQIEFSDHLPIVFDFEY